MVLGDARLFRGIWWRGNKRFRMGRAGSPWGEGGSGRALPSPDFTKTSIKRSWRRALPCCSALMNHSSPVYPSFSKRFRLSFRQE